MEPIHKNAFPLLIGEITESQFQKALLGIIENLTSYRDAMIELQKEFPDQPLKKRDQYLVDNWAEISEMLRVAYYQNHPCNEFRQAVIRMQHGGMNSEAKNLTSLGRMFPLACGARVKVDPSPYAQQEPIVGRIRKINKRNITIVKKGGNEIKLHRQSSRIQVLQLWDYINEN